MHKHHQRIIHIYVKKKLSTDEVLERASERNEYIFLSIILIIGIGVASCMSGVFESGTTAILPGSYNGLLMLQVCKFLEVSKLSFSLEYGPKLKEDYVMVKHLPKIPRDDDAKNCCPCHWFSCCNDNWQKVMQSYKRNWI